MKFFLCLSALLLAQPAEQLRFHATSDGRDVVARLPASLAEKLPKGRLSQEQGQEILRIGLLDEGTKKPGPAMLGKYDRHDNELTFTPRFAFVAGQSYRATLTIDGKTVTLDHRMPMAAAKSPPKVVKIYPTTDVLPANHLKFYIYFDRPMRGGKELFNLIQLVDDKGKVIDDPWLIDEIWDEDNNCLIIFIHPGRIKWGVELRELLGPVLFEKRNYSLVVRGELTDLDGNKFGKDVVKKFRTTPEDRVRIDLADWKLQAAKAGTKEPLTLSLPKSIDHRSLQRFLTVKDEMGREVEGAIEIGKDEKAWRFTPKSAWQARDYHVHIDGELEDVAGNTPLKAFDHDLKAPKLAPQKLRLEFRSR